MYRDGLQSIEDSTCHHYHECDFFQGHLTVLIKRCVKNRCSLLKHGENDRMSYGTKIFFIKILFFNVEFTTIANRNFRV